MGPVALRKLQCRGDESLRSLGQLPERAPECVFERVLARHTRLEQLGLARKREAELAHEAAQTHATRPFHPQHARRALLGEKMRKRLLRPLHVTLSAEQARA